MFTLSFFNIAPVKKKKHVRLEHTGIIEHSIWKVTISKNSQQNKTKKEERAEKTKNDRENI